MEGQRYSWRQSIELVSNRRTWVCHSATHGAHNDDEKAGPRESFLRLNDIKWHNLSGIVLAYAVWSDLKSKIEKALGCWASYGSDLEKLAAVVFLASMVLYMVDCD